MNKSEFLNILRLSLSGEVAPNILEQNISYYDGYISAQTVEEEHRIIDGLGDPRLIAKTIIEAEKAAKEKSKGTWSESNYQGYTSEQEEHRENSAEFNRGIFFSKMKWHHKLIAVAVVIVLFVIIALIGRLLLGFLFAFGLPILLLVLVMSLLRRR